MLFLFSFFWGVSCKSTKQLEEFATVVVNGPYDLNKTEEEHPFLIISYEKCTHVQEYFRLVAVGDAGYAELKPTQEQKECIDSLKKGTRVSVVIDSTINHLSGLKSWNTKQIQNCDLNGIYSGVRFEVLPEGNCTWME